MNGMMTQSWTVWCAKCCKMDTTSGNKTNCAKEFKQSGWVRKNGIGWLCPDCAKYILINRPTNDSQK